MKMDFKKTWAIIIIAAFTAIATGYFSLKRSAPIYWDEDARQMYRISSRTVIQMIQPGTKSMHGRMELAGILNFRILEITDDHVKAAFQFSPIRIIHEGRRSMDAERLYSKFFFAEFSPQGRLLSFDFSNEISEEDEKSLEDVIKSFQIVIKDSMFGKWNTEEDDGHGIYESLYTLKEDSVEKSKNEYLEISDEKDAERIDIKKSILAVEYGKPDSWIKEANGNELVVFYSGGEPLLKVSSTMSLKIISFSPDKSLAIWNDNAGFNELITVWQTMPKNTVSLARRREMSDYEKRFGGKSFKKVADALFKIHSTFDVNCLRALMDYLKFKPEAAASFPEYLLNSSLNPDQRVTLVHALERVGSPEAQTALSRIMKGTEFRMESRRQAAIAFGGIDKPTGGSIRSLWEAYEAGDSGEENAGDVASTAVLSLGAMAKNLENDVNEEYREISHDIKNRISADLESNPELNIKVALLHAAGNTADRGMIEYITSNFEDDNPRVRSAAVTSLKYMEDREVNEILSEELDREDNINVRNAIVTTMYSKLADEESVAKVIDNIPIEENDIVRGQMYRYLLKNRDLPGVKDALRGMLKNERVMEHRRIIHTAISTSKKSSTGNEK